MSMIIERAVNHKFLLFKNDHHDTTQNINPGIAAGK